MESLDSEDDIDLQLNIDEEPSALGILRSQSVPPELDGSPHLKRRELPAHDTEDEGLGQDTGSFGAGGRLASSRSDPTRFRVHIEGKTVAFELSVVDSSESTRGTVFDGRDEVEASNLV
jgi:phosphatidate phosphatase LPIN